MELDNYFTVSPMSKRLEKLEPGKTYTGSVNIINPNVAKEDFYYSVSVAPYGVVGTDYKADLTTDTNYTMLSKWVTIDHPTGVVPPIITAKAQHCSPCHHFFTKTLPFSCHSC